MGCRPGSPDAVRPANLLALSAAHAVAVVPEVGGEYTEWMTRERSGRRTRCHAQTRRIGASGGDTAPDTRRRHPLSTSTQRRSHSRHPDLVVPAALALGVVTAVVTGAGFIHSNMPVLR